MIGCNSTLQVPHYFFLAPNSSNVKNTRPSFKVDTEKVKQPYSSSTPKLINISKKSAYQISVEIFPEMRNFNRIELEKYEASLNKLYKPTGRNLF